MARQYFHTNLLERMSTPPFLTAVEKRWLAFQLLQAVRQCHDVSLCHGDIKAENVMVTSWAWLFLTDFASFKPSMLPPDDPSDFHYFFCASRRGAVRRPRAARAHTGRRRRTPPPRSRRRRPWRAPTPRAPFRVATRRAPPPRAT